MTPLRRALAVAVAAGLGVNTSVSAGSAPAEEPNDLVELLSMLPASVVERGGDLYYVDMTVMWDRIGVGADPDERRDALGELGRPETWAIGPSLFDRGRVHDLEGARAEVGFSAVEIDRELAVVSPPHSLYIDETSVSTDTVIAALETNPVWSPELTEVETDHGSYFTWGNDPEAFNPDRVSPFRRLGQAGQLAVIGDERAVTVRTLDPADVEAALAVVVGGGEPAAATAPLAPVVELLADADVVQLVGVPRPIVFGPPLGVTPEQLEALLEDVRLLDPYAAIFIVELHDGDDFRTEVLIVHADEAVAAANEPIVADVLANGVNLQTQQPLADLFPDAGVTVDGVVLRVTLPGADSFARAFQMLQDSTLFPTA